jgi:hypothetical protein
LLASDGERLRRAGQPSKPASRASVGSGVLRAKEAYRPDSRFPCCGGAGVWLRTRAADALPLARLGAVSAPGHQLGAALRRIANSGEPHSGQWPSQPGRPLGRVTARGSAMGTFWPQTHQPCGPGSCTSSVCGSTMCDKHNSWLRVPYAGRPNRWTAAAGDRGRRSSASALRLHADSGAGGSIATSVALSGSGSPAGSGFSVRASFPTDVTC